MRRIIFSTQTCSVTAGMKKGHWLPRCLGAATLLIVCCVLFAACASGNKAQGNTPGDNQQPNPQGNNQQQPQSKSNGNGPPTQDEVKQTLTNKLVTDNDLDEDFGGGKPKITTDFSPIQIGQGEKVHACILSADPSITTDYPVDTTVTITVDAANPITLPNTPPEKNKQFNSRTYTYGRGEQPPQLFYFFRDAHNGQWNFCKGPAQ